MSREPSMGNGPLKWQFPRIPMLEYGGPRPYYQPFQSCYPPMMGRPLGPSYYPFAVMQSPPLYGVFNSRPPTKMQPSRLSTPFSSLIGVQPGLAEVSVKR
ncbi:hypothetical protein GOBAR_DD05053 [Gossypium barbadense]|nr:hypothetical protein GOBAR_DD05053 [Gossypium barbadense]